MISDQPDHFGEIWIQLYHYAWFVSFGVSLLSYVLLMKFFGQSVRHNSVIAP